MAEQTYPVPNTREPVFTQVLSRAYTLNWEMIAYLVILVLALGTRFIDLGARVMSHDESLHTYYSWRLYEYGEFQHTPLMHGPVLFHMVALSYFLFGDNDFTARIYPAVLGVLLVMFPLLLRRWLGRTGAVLAAVLLLISPMTMYYNRYIREDTPSVFYTFVFVYAILQYIDGEHPRRPIWLFVMSGSLLLTLASKEVAFIYIAIFGSFFTLWWLMRMVQDIGILRRPTGSMAWEAPALQLVIGHLIVFGLAAAVALVLGGFMRFVLSSLLWLPSNALLQIPLFLVIYLPLALSGFVRTSFAPDDERRDGAAAAIMRGLSNGRSALSIILAGVIIGGIVALLIIAAIDVIKPDAVWKPISVMSLYDQTYGSNGTKEYAQAISFDGAMFVRLLTWVGVPVLGILFVLFITAVFTFPGMMPLPWREILLIFLIAMIVCGVLVMFERRSFVEEAQAAPFAADPNAEAAIGNGHYDNTPILISWIIGAAITIVVLLTRFLTNWWDFLNRQPVFDILIVIGTMVLPWLSAFPLYWAGYDLEEYNVNTQIGRDTLEAAAVGFIPFALVSITVGLSWNWKRWLPAAAVFIGLFSFFFTTVFSNQYGMATGMVGSLGYWLEQQEVRRGSQPQYYYLLTQLPVYEFLPMIGALCAGTLGLSRLWRWRRDQGQAARSENEAVYTPVVEDEALLDAPAAETVISEINQTQSLPPPSDEVLDSEEQPVSPARYAGLPWRLYQPFSAKEEEANRTRYREWIGPVPFLGLVGYWAIMNLLGLTIAGEKMPWLTIHLTLPLILLTGWWLGRVVDGIDWQAVRDGGWLVLLVALPLVFVAMAQVILPLWGTDSPFGGRKPEDLAVTGTWLAALLILLGALYLVGRIGGRLGLAQLGRMALLTGVLILGLLTARAAFWACFVNYDYATEFLVYAHSGPEVKTVMREVDRIAEMTNEGSNMRLVFDDESSWPFTWYLRHYPNYGFLRGEAGSVDPATLDNARVVIVGNKKVGDVRRILGDRYYELGFIRLWWPMQEYFNLTYQRVANVFSNAPDNIAASYFRQGLFDIWLRRDYRTYAQAMCIENKQTRCEAEALQGETSSDQDRYRDSCQSAVINECRDDPRFEVKDWPVSDRMYFFVDKQIAATIWDAGVGSATVDIREPEYPEDRVYRDIASESILGTGAGLSGPRGVAVSDEGLIYVTDTDNNRIAVFNGAGELVQVIGTQPGGGSDPGALRQPWGIDIGPNGNLYVADTWNHRIQVFNAAGEVVDWWGHEGIPSTDASVDAFWGPRDVKIGPDGNVYVADTGNKRIRVYTSDGQFIHDIGSTGSALGQLDEPVGLAFNPVSGELYVAEAWNRRIQVFDQNGQPVRAWDVNMWFENRQSFNRPYLAVSPDGTLIYVSDMDDGRRIVAYNLNGMPIVAFNQPDNLEANLLGLRSPAGLAFDNQGRLYVIDSEQGMARIFIFPPADFTGGILPQSADATEVVAEPVTEEATEDSAAPVTEQATEPVTEQPVEPATEESTEIATEAPAG